MPNIGRSYVTAGAALLGASVMAAVPVPAADFGTPQTRLEVNLTAAQTATSTSDGSNIFNIPANLFIALANVPHSVLVASGEGNVQFGSEPNSEFSFQPTFEGVTLTQPEGNVAGLGRNLRYTGSWWVYSQTNILGTDPADPSRYQAITNILVPFPALSVTLGNIIAAIAASQLPMDVGCTGTGPGSCDNVAGILSKMFNLSNIAALFSPDGYTYPTTRAPITCSDSGQCYVKDEEGPEVPWSGQNVKLDAAAPITSFYNSLTKTPDINDIRPATPELAGETLFSLGNGVNTAFNPFVLGTQCAICAPLVPNPNNVPVPGPVFEDPDSAATTGIATAEVPDETPPDAAADAATDARSEVDETDTPATKAPKHRKPTATSEAVKNVKDSITATVSKISESFKKPSVKSLDKETKGNSDAGTNGKNSAADSASDNSAKSSKD